MHTEFQERDIGIATLDRSCSSLNTAEYQIPHCYGLVHGSQMQRTLEMCVSIRACSSLLNPSSLSYSRRMRTRIFVVILRCSNDY